MPSFSFTIAEAAPTPAVPFAQLNGIVLPVSIRSAQLEPAYLEDEGRSFSGMARRMVRSDKREWTLELTPQSQLASRAYYGLVNGFGHVFNFTTTGLYSSTGLAPQIGHTASVLTAGSGPHPGTSYLRVPATTTITWPTALGANAPWTVVAWRKETATWKHYILMSDGDGWVDGVYDATATDAATFISFDSAGNLILTGATNKTDMYDVAVLPYLFPSSWGEQVYDYDVDFARSGLPRLHAKGQLFYTNEDPVYVMGRVVSANLVPFAGARNGEQLSIKLREV